MSNDHFDWHEDESVVLREQPATAVYMNGTGDLLIRQRDTCGDEDQFIYLRPENVHRIVQALLEAVDCETPYREPLTLPKPEPLTGAQRQKRYRDKQRNGNSGAIVTESDELPLHRVTDDQELGC